MLTILHTLCLKMLSIRCTKWLRLLKRHAPQFSSCTPHLSSLHPHSPRTPLCCIVNPKIAHFKGFFGLAWAHAGPRWLKIALNHLFEHPKWSRNNFGKNHC